jgi:hypothetical protein
VIGVRPDGSNFRLYIKKRGVIGVRQSQSNTDHPTLFKKNGTSDTKTIKNGFGIESTII